MGFLYLLSVKAPNRFFLAVLLGAVAGALYSLLIPVILSAVTPSDPLFVVLNDNVRTIFGIKVNKMASV